MGEWEQPARPATLRRRLAMAAVALLAVVGIGLALASRAGDAGSGVGNGLTVERDTPPESAPARVPAPPEGEDEGPDPPEGQDGRESDSRDGPEGEHGPGGRAAEQPRVGRWRALSASPLPAGTVAASAWTGTELLVWQGAHAAGARSEAARLAAYDPEQDSWRSVADAPARMGPGTGAVWTGEELVALGALDTADEAPWADHAVAYRPDDDSWRDMAPPPIGNWLWEAAVWNGERVVVLGSSFAPVAGPEPAAVAYDPERDAWEELPPPPVWSQGGRLQAVALGEAVVVVGETPAENWDEAKRALTSYDPATEEWAQPDRAPYQGLWSVGLAADPARGRVVLVGAVLDGTWRDLTGTWTPRHGVTWDSLPPRRAWGQQPPHVVVTDKGVVAWAPGSERGWLLDEGEDEGEAAWRPLARLPEGPRRGKALAWTGRELLVWGGASGQALSDDGAAWTLD